MNLRQGDAGAIADLRARLETVHETVDRALARAGRPAGSVTVVGVSKTVPAAVVRAAFVAGLRHVGENRIQEGRQKQADLADLPLTWHLVGHLQRNKVRYVVGSWALVHSLDRLPLAEELDRRARRAGVVVDCLVQVNVGGEATKSGVAPDGLLPLLESLVPLEAIRVRGLMTIPPPAGDPERVRPYFAALRRLAERAAQAFPGRPGDTGPAARIRMEHLSMGMSSDYPVAVEEGATIIRVGEALFGPRSAWEGS
ncbi:MAG TPA: YggS family pyridoxal phosphate-dependent enzyme [Bacillota bacterium]